MTKHVFTYGSLMFADVWSRVVRGAYRAVDGTLEDHARHAVRDATYPAMVPRAGGRVDGVVYLDVDDDDLARLDRFEDDYERATVSIACADGATREAETYLYLSHDRLLPEPWDPERFATADFIAAYCPDEPAA